VRGYRDLIAASTMALICAAVVLCVPVRGIEVAAAIPLCLFLPGYAITAAAFSRHRLDIAQVLLLSLGLSLATLATGGLVLNLTPGGIRAFPWAVLLVAIVSAGCLYAAFARPPRPAMPAPTQGLRLRLGLADGVFLLAAVITAAAAVALARTPLSAENAIGYTQLWILPNESGSGARIGVASQEQTPLRYTLEVRSGAGPPVSSSVKLMPGQERILRIRTGGNAAGRPRPVTALLFRDDDPTVVYRRVSAWVPGPRTSG
jgi:uncharacterized membrane protein